MMRLTNGVFKSSRWCKMGSDMKSRHMLLICTVILPLGIICPAAIAQAAEKTSYVPVTTAEEAVERALAYTGFDKLEDLDLTDRREMACLTVARDSTTPFLSDSINGRTVWQVDVQDVILDLDWAKPDVVLKYPKDVRVTIDSATGRLFEIRLLKSGDEYDPSYTIPADTSEKQIRSLNGEVFLGFPIDTPGMTFLEVLNVGDLCGSPLTAGLTVGHYVVHYVFRSDTLPAWTIDTHTLQPGSETSYVPARGPNLGSYPWQGRCHIVSRSVVDAMTGELIHRVVYGYDWE